MFSVRRAHAAVFILSFHSMPSSAESDFRFTQKPFLSLSSRPAASTQTRRSTAYTIHSSLFKLPFERLTQKCKRSAQDALSKSVGLMTVVYLCRGIRNQGLHALPKFSQRQVSDDSIFFVGIHLVWSF